MFWLHSPHGFTVFCLKKPKNLQGHCFTVVSRTSWVLSWFPDLKNLAAFVIYKKRRVKHSLLFSLLGTGKFYFYKGYGRGRKGSLRQSNLRSRKSDGFRLINDSFTKPSEMYTWPETSPECVLYSLLRTKEAAKIQRIKTSIWLLVELWSALSFRSLDVASRLSVVLVSLYVQKLPLRGSLQLDIIAVPWDGDAVDNGALILTSYYMLSALYLIFPKCHRYILSSRVFRCGGQSWKTLPKVTLPGIISARTGTWAVRLWLLVLQLCPGRRNSQEAGPQASSWPVVLQTWSLDQPSQHRWGPCHRCRSSVPLQNDQIRPRWVGSVACIWTSSQLIRVHADMCKAPHFGTEALGPQVRTLSKFMVRAGAETTMWSLFCALHSCPHTDRKTPDVGIQKGAHLARI